MNPVPTNIIPYFLAALATLVVGIRSTQNYRRLGSPLSRHFAVSGFLASAGLFLYSVPFVVVDNQAFLRTTIILGRLCLDIVAYYQIYLIWYLTSLRKIRLRWLVLPLIAIAVPGFITQAYHFAHSFVGIQNGEAIYSLNQFAVVTHAFSLLIVFLAGVVLAKSAVLQKDFRGKIRLFSVALLYMAAAASDMYNVLALQGLNNSWIVYLGFAIASGGFLITTLFFLRSKTT